MKRRTGFTLVEMVLVIILTLILTATSIAGLSGVKTWRSAAAVRRVHADVVYARNQALLSGRRTLCVFDTVSMNYELRQEATPGNGALVTTVIDHPLADDPWQVNLADLYSNLTITGTSGLAPFSPGFGSDGTLINTSGAVLSSDIQMYFSNGATLTIYAGSGLSEVSW